MSLTVCLSACTLGYPEGGGHAWVYLNWALGLKAQGCRVIWLEGLHPSLEPGRAAVLIEATRRRLRPHGLADGLALYSLSDPELSPEVARGCHDLNAAAEADLLLNLHYATPPELVARFRRSALIDIDPGLLQCWMARGHIRIAPHDSYFTIGETVGQAGACFPDGGLEWLYTPPCVALDEWTPHPAPEGTPFTTVSHWYMDEWERDGNEPYRNDKREGFLPFLDLPRRTSLPLELALCLRGDEVERLTLLERGWSVRDSAEVAATPEGYRRYVQGSRGEFSCVKPSCVRLQNAWISDRTICYLASGKPAVAQHTGPSRFLPEAAGLFRFRDVDEAARHLDAVAGDYDRQCRLARALAEEYFDARKVAGSVLERAL